MVHSKRPGIGDAVESSNLGADVHQSQEVPVISPVHRDDLPFTPPASDRMEEKRRVEQLRAEVRQAKYGSINEILDAAEELEHPELKEIFIAEALLVYSRENFEEAADFLLKDARRSPELLQRFVDSWDRETFDAPESEPAYALEGFREFVRSNPGKASSFLGVLPSGGIKTVASFETVEIWYGRDPAAAIDWVVSLPEASEQDESTSFAMMALGEQWGGNEGIAAIDWVMNRPDPVKWEPFISGAITSLSGQDYTLVTDWFATVDNESLRRSLAPQVAEITATKSLSDAVAILNACKDRELRQDVLLAMAFASIEVRPQETMEWLGTLESDEVSKNAITHASAAWADVSRNDIERWLKGNPNYTGRDYAISGMLTADSSMNYPSSVMWSMEIEDAQLRKEMIQNTVKVWREDRGIDTADKEMVAFLDILSQRVSPQASGEVRDAVLALDLPEE